MTEREIARLSSPVLQAYRDMEDELLRMIARQIGKDKRVSDTSKWLISHLARAGEVNRQALMIIDSYAGGVDAECAEAILAAAEGEVGTLDEAMLSLLSEPGEMTGDVQQALDAFSRQGRQELAVQDARIAEPYAQALTERCNMVNTVMGYSAVSAYNNAVREIARNAGEIDRSAVLREMNAGAASVVMGTESIQQATRQTIHRMAEKGLPGFVDKAGRQWSPEAYVRMDLRTTMGNTARAAQDARCDEWGIQLIEVSSHNGARPKCAPYQGRIFSRDGSRGVTRDLDGNQIEYIPLSETSYGEPDGLFGINCGHQQYPFIPGASVRRYYPYPEEENAEHYRELQGQRALERKIRADKRECMMLQETGDEEGLRKAAGQLKADRQKYAAYSEAHGLGVHGDRTQVYGYDRSKSMKTVWAGRTNGNGTVGNAADSTAVSTMAAPAGTTANYVPYSLTGSGGSGIINSDVSDTGYIPSNKPREVLLKMIEKSNSLDKPIFSVDTEDNDFPSRARKVVPKEGYYDVFSHGTSSFFMFFGTRINATDLAKIIKSRKDYKIGTPIRLFSCNTGNRTYTADCFAQLFATAMNVDVLAPDDLVYLELNGDFYIGEPGNKEFQPFWSRYTGD